MKLFNPVMMFYSATCVRAGLVSSPGVSMKPAAVEHGLVGGGPGLWWVSLWLGGCSGIAECICSASGSLLTKQLEGGTSSEV